MVIPMFVAAVLLFLLLFIFDISFNLRRLLKNMDRIWRKMEEINTTLQSK
jgi:flagellar biogenesis protein FliO